MTATFARSEDEALWRRLSGSPLLARAGFRALAEEDARTTRLAIDRGLGGDLVRALAITKSGSWVGRWRDGDADRVVWIDSEGTPRETLASTLADFAAIAGHGEGVLYDRLQHAIRDADGAWAAMGWTDEALRAMVERMSAHDLATSQRRGGWATQLGIHVDPRPFDRIRDALAAARFSCRSAAAHPRGD